MIYSDKMYYIVLIAGIIISFLIFLLAGGGSLLDKWIDGIRNFVNRTFDFLPVWGIKTVRILWYLVYAAIVIFIFTHITD